MFNPGVFPRRDSKFGIRNSKLFTDNLPPTTGNRAPFTLIELLARQAVLSRRSFFAKAEVPSVSAGRRQVRKAFTLIELLVVIAIISILMAILLPSLSKARGMAKAAVCLSNMKQIGIGITGYALDFNGGMMGIGHPNWKDTGNIWWAILGRNAYIGPPRTLKLQHVDNREGMTDTVVYPILECPGETTQTSMTSAEYSGVGYTNFTHQYMCSSYDMAYDVVDITPNSWHNFCNGFLNITAPGTKPETAFIIGDNELYNSIGWMLPNFSYYTAGDNSNLYNSNDETRRKLNYAFRHLNKATVLFMDAHATSRRSAILSREHLYRDIWVHPVDNHGSAWNW